jgi:membrane peptidoglycan carboxypeptidase
MKLFGTLLAFIGRVLLPHSARQLNSTIRRTNAHRAMRRSPPTLVAALVAGEDHRFYRHKGVDPIAIASALFRLVVRGKLSGASTIEQQLVRVLTDERERTLRRKLKEILLAAYTSNNYSKSDIAEMYLGVAYFGWGMNGAEEACRYLSIPLPEASRRQAASLIARLKYPQPYALTAERQFLIARRTEHILMLMSRTQETIQREVPSDAPVLDIREM